MRPRERPQNAADRQLYDRRRNRPTFFAVRYADDFVVLTDGTIEDAEAEKLALAQFLKLELRMELSMEKTRITQVGEGFDFLGYRVVQTKARRTGRLVGNLFIPKSKLKDLRRKIKVRVRETPTGKSLADLIDSLNPVVTGWRNYYRYATWATRDFSGLDWWLWERIGRWLHRKYPKATWKSLRRRFVAKAPDSRWRWVDGPKSLWFFREGGSTHFPLRGIRIPNGWNDPDEKFRKGADRFWASFNTLISV